MSKNFDDFMKSLNSKDWSLAVNDIGDKIQGKSHEEAMILINIYSTATILREYHNWLNDNQ